MLNLKFNKHHIQGLAGAPPFELMLWLHYIIHQSRCGKREERTLVKRPHFTRACVCFILAHTCWLGRMRGCAQRAGVMRDRLLVLAPVVFNPSPEARISSSLSHRSALSLAEHLAMQALINTGMAILSVTERGVGGTGGGLMSAWEEKRKREWGEANKKKKPRSKSWVHDGRESVPCVIKAYLNWKVKMLKTCL